MKRFQKMKLLSLTVAFLMIFPVVAFAVEVTDLLLTVGGIIKATIPVLVALALLYFFWGLAKFVLNADNEQARTDGKQIMIWGIVALFVIVAVWGLVTVLQTTFGVTTAGAPAVINVLTPTP